MFDTCTFSEIFLDEYPNCGICNEYTPLSKVIVTVVGS
jgi:hypothetical protein